MSKCASDLKQLEQLAPDPDGPGWQFTRLASTISSTRSDVRCTSGSFGDRSGLGEVICRDDWEIAAGLFEKPGKISSYRHEVNPCL